MKYKIGDKIIVKKGSMNLASIVYENDVSGVISNIKYDAVASTYSVKFSNGKIDEFYRFQLE